jgi:hypothetical protein
MGNVRCRIKYIASSTKIPVPYLATNNRHDHVPDLSTATGAITSRVEPAMSAAAGTTKDNLFLVNGVVIAAAATHRFLSLSLD